MAISEFHIERDAFKYRWTLPEFMALVHERGERNKRMEAKTNAPTKSDIHKVENRYTEPVTPEDSPAYSSIGRLRKAFAGGPFL